MEELRALRTEVPELRQAMRLLEHKPDSVASVSWRRNRAAEALHAVILRTVEGLPSAPYLFRAGRVIGTRECVVHPQTICPVSTPIRALCR